MQLNQAKYQTYKRIIEELCVGTQDKHAGKKIELLPWQLDLLQSMCMEDENGDPQYRLVWVELPRKNGKSFTIGLLAVIGLLTTRNPSVICAASTRDQAKILYNYVFDMVQLSPKLRQLLKPLRHQIRVRNAPGHMKAISSDGKAQHGLNPGPFIIADEIHTWSELQGRELWEALQTSLGARSSTMIAITTAGSAYSFAWKMHDYCSKVAAGKIDDPRTKAIIYKADEDCDPFDRKQWALANPGLGTVLKWDYLEDMANKAKHDPQALLSFKKLHLNIWQGSATPYIMPEDWNSCAVDGLPVDGPCWVGVDLSAVNDFTAYALFFEQPQGYYVKCLYQITNKAWEKRQQRYPDLVHDWEENGHLSVIPGDQFGAQDQLTMIESILDRYQVQKVLYDPWNASEMVNLLQDRYGPDLALAVGQSTRMINEPMKWLYKATLSRKIKHDGNPVTGWMVGNVELQEDKNGNWHYSKERSSDRIDGVSAMITAISGYIHLEAASFYESNDLVII